MRRLGGRWGSAPPPEPDDSVELTAAGELAWLRSEMKQIDQLTREGLRGRDAKGARDALLDIFLLIHPVKVRASVPAVAGPDGAREPSGA